MTLISNLKQESHPPPSIVPAPHHATLLLRSTESSANTSRSPTPVLGARKTPFHLPKTLVLDLDETLIHSTSRPLNTFVSGGSGFFGLGSFSGRNKGASHMVEVVLEGRTTLYHVYKRPFVDFFLRTVCLGPFFLHDIPAEETDTGFGMVHARYIYRIYARVCGPSNRLVRCRPRHTRPSLVPGCAFTI